MKVKRILLIEAGLEMVAFAMAISSEVSHSKPFKPFSFFSVHQNGGVFPETPGELKEFLRRFEYNSFLSTTN